MRAWVVDQPGPMRTGPLRLIERDRPEPAAGELLIKVLACGVCRTDLHLAEGDLPPRRPQVTPGHEVVGDVVAVGDGAIRREPGGGPAEPVAAGFAVGDRVGVAWLAGTDGTCRYCLSGSENLCPASVYTGWDNDGGYAEYLVASAAYVHRLPAGLSDEHAAPLLCAGIIGYRALIRAALPPAGALGIWGFGGSAHLTAQLAVAQGAAVHVFTRSAAAQRLARELGAASVQGSRDPAPEPLDSAILFAPSGDLVPVALQALAPGGTLAVAGIYLTEIPALDYEHDLFGEREVRSVTANTRQDAAEFLRLAERLGVRSTVQPYPFDQAEVALTDLAEGRITGAAVLIM